MLFRKDSSSVHALWSHQIFKSQQNQSVDHKESKNETIWKHKRQLLSRLVLWTFYFRCLWYKWSQFTVHTSSHEISKWEMQVRIRKFYWASEILLTRSNVWFWRINQGLLEMKYSQKLTASFWLTQTNERPRPLNSAVSLKIDCRFKPNFIDNLWLESMFSTFYQLSNNSSPSL